MFKNSFKSLKSTKVLCSSAILAALFVVLYALKLPLTPELRITFTFIPLAIAGWLFGPVIGMLVGMVGDVVGALLFPSGAYFPGFTLTSMLTGLIFGIFLYNKNEKNSILWIFLSKFLINMLLNVALNSLWLSIITNKGYVIFFAQHIFKNIAALPIEIILLFIILKILSSHGIKKMYK